jgi:hypothetical protein
VKGEERGVKGDAGENRKNDCDDTSSAENELPRRGVV